MAAGGEFLDNHQVTAITPGPEVTIATNHGDFQARRLVITAGAWAPRIARQLGLELPFTVSEGALLHVYPLIPRSRTCLRQKTPHNKNYIHEKKLNMYAVGNMELSLLVAG